MVGGCGAWEVEGVEAFAEEGMIAAETGEADVPVGVDEGGVESGDERRGEGGGDAIAIGPCAEIEGTGEAVWGGASVVLVEDDGETGDGTEAFAAGG